MRLAPGGSCPRWSRVDIYAAVGAMKDSRRPPHRHTLSPCALTDTPAQTSSLTTSVSCTITCLATVYFRCHVDLFVKIPLVSVQYHVMSYFRARHLWRPLFDSATRATKRAAAAGVLHLAGVFLPPSAGVERWELHDACFLYDISGRT